MINDFPEAPESVALALMQIIEEAEEKDGLRRGNRRGNLSEKERLIALYKDCLTAVTGLDCSRPITMH